MAAWSLKLWERKLAKIAAVTNALAEFLHCASSFAQ